MRMDEGSRAGSADRGLTDIHWGGALPSAGDVYWATRVSGTYWGN
ncbi:hypothetical protein [Streptomyces sp. TLI_171]|nr:hypothetical protein [Streptomyces sp. TLI_171]RKE02884.1 hypothetical protein BX266_7486 [Streptomyces sp. TLI_171]